MTNDSTHRREKHSLDNSMKALTILEEVQTALRDIKSKHESKVDKVASYQVAIRFHI